MQPIKTSLIIVGLCSVVQCADAQEACVHVEVTMEAHGFMCPFLTPMFLGHLEDKGAHWVSHDPDASSVEFALPLDSLTDAEAFTRFLVLIGYEEKQIGYPRFDTTAVVPPNPEP